MALWALYHSTLVAPGEPTTPGEKLVVLRWALEDHYRLNWGCHKPRLGTRPPCSRAPSAHHVHNLFSTHASTFATHPSAGCFHYTSAEEHQAAAWYPRSILTRIARLGHQLTWGMPKISDTSRRPERLLLVEMVPTAPYQQPMAPPADFMQPEATENPSHFTLQRLSDPGS
jgi:hypothetical protein